MTGDGRTRVRFCTFIHWILQYLLSTAGSCLERDRLPSSQRAGSPDQCSVFREIILSPGSQPGSSPVQLFRTGVACVPSSLGWLWSRTVMGCWITWLLFGGSLSYSLLILLGHAEIVHRFSEMVFRLQMFQFVTWSPTVLLQIIHWHLCWSKSWFSFFFLSILTVPLLCVQDPPLICTELSTVCIYFKWGFYHLFPAISLGERTGWSDPGSFLKTLLPVFSKTTNE